MTSSSSTESLCCRVVEEGPGYEVGEYIPVQLRKNQFFEITFQQNSDATIDEDVMRRYKKIINKTCQYVVDLFNKYLTHVPQDTVKLEIIQPNSRQVVQSKNVFIFCVDPTDQKPVKAYANTKNRTISVRIPKRLLDGLVTIDVEKLTVAKKRDFEHILCPMIHEIFHMFGALHFRQGIMSGYLMLFNEGPNLNLEDFVDDITLTIFAAAMAKHKCRTLSMYVDFKPPFAVSVGCCVQGIQMVVVVKNNTYVYQMRGHVKFQLNLQNTSKWDAVLVVGPLGQIHYYTQENISNGEPPLRTFNYE